MGLVPMARDLKKSQSATGETKKGPGETGRTAGFKEEKKLAWGKGSETREGTSEGSNRANLSKKNQTKKKNKKKKKGKKNQKK